MRNAFFESFDNATHFVFLDIDGVLNEFGGKNVWGDVERHRLSPFGEGPFLLDLSKKQAQGVKALGGQIIWTTTWQDESWMVGEIVGIDAPFLDLERPGWKRQSVETFLRHNTRPFVWFEDETGPYGTFNSRPLHDLEGLVVNTNALTGITQADIMRASDWLQERNLL